MMSDDRRAFHDDKRNNTMHYSAIGAVILAIAVVNATAVMLLTSGAVKVTEKPVETAVATSKVTVVPARPSTSPTADPILNSMKLYAFGSEITSDGFTAYVGDKISLSIKMEPRYTHPPVYWTVSDENAAKLSISDDRLSCDFTVLKAARKIELTVSCYGMEEVFPVYLWER